MRFYRKVRHTIVAALLLSAIATLVLAAPVGYIPTAISTDTVTGKLGRRATVSCRLTQFFSGQPIAGATVECYLMYPTYRVNLGSRVTDRNGVASATVALVSGNISGTGRYTVGWFFAGNGVYSPPVPVGGLNVVR